MKEMYITIEQAKKIAQLERMLEFEAKDREELKDFIDVNDVDTVIDYIQGLERKIVSLENAIDTQKTLMGQMVAKSRYNAIVKEYNKKEENKTKWKKTL